MSPSVSLRALRLSSERRRWMAAVVVCLGQLMLVLDASVLNVALPVIQRDLHFGTAELGWVLNAYLITFGGFLLLAGRLGDLVGRKRVFMAGLVLFTTASAVCGAAQSAAMLLAARAVQGVGAAVASSVIVAILAAEFTAPRERARAMGLFAFVAVGGGSMGLLAGGVITSVLNWHWIFFVNLPIGAVVLVLGGLLIVERPGSGLRGDADVGGAILITGALMLLVYGLVQASDHGWTSIATLGPAAASMMLVGLFVVLEARLANPLVPLRIFRVRTVAAGNIARCVLTFALFGWFFTVALFLEHVWHYSPLDTGLALTPMTVVLGLVSVSVAAHVITGFGAKRAAVAGLALVALGLAEFARAPVHSHYLSVMLPGMMLLGIGNGVGTVAVTTMGMADVPTADAGLASGLIATSQRVGSSIGVALMATLAASRTQTLLARGNAKASALAGGYHLAFLVGAVVAAAAIPPLLLLLRHEPRETTAGRSAEASELAAAE